MPDVVAIGTQETNGEREEWEFGLQETLGPGHVLFHSVELGTLHLAVFLRRDLIWVCSGISYNVFLDCLHRSGRETRIRNRVSFAELKKN